MGEWTSHGIVTPSTRKGINDAFISFQNASHLIAANLVGVPHYVPMTMFERTPETLLSTLRTAISIENFLVEKVPERIPNRWSVARHLPPEAMSYQPIYITEEVREFLTAGLKNSN